MDKKAYNFNAHGFNEYGIHRITGKKYDTRGRKNEDYYKLFDKSGIYIQNGTRYDPEGYDCEGLDEHGFNRQGFYKNTQAICDPEGYHANGYNRHGFNRDGIHRNGTRYDEKGRDCDGYDRKGYDSRGFNRWGFSRNGTRYNAKGRDCDGYDHEGYNSRGFNRDGIHRNGTRYDEKGRDCDDLNRWRSSRDVTTTNTSQTEQKFQYDENGIDQYGFNKRGIHIGQTSLTGKISYIDEKGFNCLGYSVTDGHSRLDGTIDPDFLCIIKFLEAPSPLVNIFAKENGYNESDVRRIFRDAEKFYPDLSEKIKEKFNMAKKIILRLIFDDVNHVVNKEMSVKDFWSNHPKLSYNGLLVAVKDEDLTFKFTCKMLESISIDETSAADAIFNLCGNRYSLQEAMDNMKTIRKRFNNLSAMTPKESSIKKYCLKKHLLIQSLLSKFESRNYKSISGTRVTFNNGKTVVYTDECIHEAIEALKVNNEYICVYTVTQFIKANS